MSYASRWSRFVAYARTSTRVISVSSVTWPSPFQNGENGLTTPSWWRSERITPSTKPAACSRISCASQPSVAPPSASPTAAPARQPTARRSSWSPFRTSVTGWSAPPSAGLRPAGRQTGRAAGGCFSRGSRLAAEIVPSVDQPLGQLLEADLVREVVPELGRRDLVLPARVRGQLH